MTAPLPNMPATAQALDAALQTVLLKDAAELSKLWHAIRQREAREEPSDRLLSRFLQRLQRSQAAVLQKQQKLPQVTYPEDLPISGKREEIAELIQAHQVVILAGETGSGKTTQLPKICLEMGRGVRGVIGHTQPRRIAAVTVASRIAEELGEPIGQSVGYQVRFSDQTVADTAIKLMTDGILLAEIQSDPLLLRYDTIIIDEAHERSLNIDFLLGYLKRILPKRADLKVIITSATIDLEKFSRHFGDAPVIEVSGRTYPVEINYRPRSDEQDDQAEAIISAIEEILTLPRSSTGDILVFLSGERDIRETAQAIRKAQFPHLEVLPLYARLSLAEQRRVFQNHIGRRVVLATNVAETSITVPGIGYVIDPGYARISRYSARTQVQRLPIEPISQASANQRAGRCGRVSNGVCFRLYDEKDFDNRPAFTDAEILRTNLASVILQMLHIGIGDIRKFPFVDPPDAPLIRDGYKLLEELQAVDARGLLTPLGRKLAALPIDPRLARMTLEAERQGALSEVLIIVSALTIQDPRERPADKQQAADEKHRRFWHEQSDFFGFLNLWQYVEEQRQALSQSQWRRQCQKEFLNFLRLREWRDLHHQMRLAIRNLGFKENAQPAAPDAVHKALLAGLLGNIGSKSDDASEYDYLGARNRKFSIFPGSSQFKKRPQWVMAAEMLETSKLYAHNVARIEPEWLLPLAEHLIKHHYYEPHYNSKTGQVLCYDRLTLFGLVIADKKQVNYNKIDPADARLVFIRSALVEGRYLKAKQRNLGQFFAHNQAQVAEVEKLEAKSRRRDILVEDEVFYNFYNERIPAEVNNLAGFEHWRKKAEASDPDLLKIPRALLMQHAAREITEVQFPDSLRLDGLELPLFYHFEPGHADDGVSLGVPASILHSVPSARLDWLVPGLLRDKCIALIKALPKQWRKKFVPVPHYVDQLLPRLKPCNRPLTQVLAEELGRLVGETLPDDLWRDVVLDEFYRMNIQVLDDRQRVIDRSRDLKHLQALYREHVQSGLQSAGAEIERKNLTGWDFGTLESSVTLRKAGINVKAFPALVKEPNGVALRVLDNPLDAAYVSRRGVVGLIARDLKETVNYLLQKLLKNKDIGLAVVNLGPRREVAEDLIFAAIHAACIADAELPKDKTAFDQAVQRGRADVAARAEELEALLLGLLNRLVIIKKAIKVSKNPLAIAGAVADINLQLEHLIYPGFLFETPAEWLWQLPRYLDAVQIRLEKAPQNLQKDKLMTYTLQDLWQKHADRLAGEGKASYADNAAWQQYRWMLEELRVSLFAQTLKTRVPVSEKRLAKVWQDSLQKG